MWRYGAAAALLDRFVAGATATLAAFLVVAEIVILFAGVVARYVFEQPLTWSDPLAAFLFLWLAMLGAVLALRRGEHMRFAGVVARMRPNRQRLFESVVLLTILVFLLLMFGPAAEYMQDEAFVTIPDLGLPDSWRVLAVEAGIVLMILTVACQAARDLALREFLAGIAVVGVISGVLVAVSPVLADAGQLNLVLFFVVLIGAAIACGVPIGFAFGVATLAYLALTTTVPLNVVVNRLDQGMSQPVLLAVPMFVFLGLLLELTGLARSMVAFLAALLDTIRGGLSYVLLGAMLLVSGISGSKAADMAAVAPSLFPEMRRRGVEEGELVALLTSSAAMADTIPPSLVLITFGSVTGLSIASLFAAGLIPALVLSFALAVVIFFRARREPTRTERVALRVVLRTFMVAIPALVLPFVIRGAVVAGIATATEVSTIGIIYVLIVGATIYRPVEWSRLGPALVDTASLSGAILFVIGAASGMAWALTQSGFSADLVTAMQGVPGGKTGFMAVTVVVFILLGNVLEGIPAILLFGPLLLPVAQTFHINGVHYAIVVVVAMSIGLFAPPFGVGFYSACAIGRVKPEAAIGPVWKYLAALTIGLVAIAAIPWLSTALL
jgi:tripartite ATP-independent transporter DctM subunit